MCRVWSYDTDDRLGKSRPVLFHGIGSEARALHVEGIRVLWKDSLTTETARKLVLQVLEGGIQRGDETVVLGPVDEASGAAIDALLKLLEEGSWIRVLLWAHDVGEVLPTLRSRCEERWCPGRPLEALSLAEWRHEGKWSDADVGPPREVMEGLVEALSKRRGWGVSEVEVWETLREGLMHRTTSSAAVDRVRAKIALWEDP